MITQSIRFSGRFGLAILAAWPSLTVGLAATRTPFEMVALVALFGLPLALLGAITWLRAGQRIWHVHQQKRLFAIACAFVVAFGLVGGVLR